MKHFFKIALLFWMALGFGQTPNPYALTDDKMSQIPTDLTGSAAGIARYIDTNFKTPSERIRALYYWTASNIVYDVPNMFEPNQLDSPEEKIDKALNTRKGVCIHYAEVFREIANLLDIHTVIVTGYTKQAGKVSPISHAWCAAKIDGQWYLFDPTWGAGYVDKQKFIKKLNNAYFKVSPQKMIYTHMPFDYLWQFLNSPWNNQEFYDGKEMLNKPKKNFDYRSEIARYEKLSENEQTFEEAARVEESGLKNALIVQYHKMLKGNFTVLTANKNIDRLNELVTKYNEAIVYFNDYMMYRQRQFKPAMTDEELKAMFQTVKDKFLYCNDEVYKIGSVGSQNAAMFSDLKKNISSNLSALEKQEAFLNDYLSKTKIGRKLMLSGRG